MPLLDSSTHCHLLQMISSPNISSLIHIIIPNEAGMGCIEHSNELYTVATFQSMFRCLRVRQLHLNYGRYGEDHRTMQFDVVSVVRQTFPLKVAHLVRKKEVKFSIQKRHLNKP